MSMYAVTIKRVLGPGASTHHTPIMEVELIVTASSEDDAEAYGDNWIAEMNVPPHTFEIDSVFETGDQSFSVPCTINRLHNASECNGVHIEESDT
jgi:hypothetical protein